jgi:hypothetical protein
VRILVTGGAGVYRLVRSRVSARSWSRGCRRRRPLDGQVRERPKGAQFYKDDILSGCDEEHPLYPVSPYGVSKLACERYITNTTSSPPCPTSRYANVYGPRRDPHGEAGGVAIFCGNLARGKTSTINGGGEIHTGPEETLLSFRSSSGDGERTRRGA